MKKKKKENYKITVTLFFNILKVKKFMKNEPDKEKKSINDRGNLKTYFDSKITHY
jgi:hypothetical protein